MMNKKLLSSKKDTSNLYYQAARSNSSQIFSAFETSMAGLNEVAIIEAREKHGSNKISHEKKQSLPRKIIQAYITPFTIVLIFLAIISFITDYLVAAPSDKDLTKTIIIAVMVIISGTLTLIQSTRSTNASEKLISMVQVTANVSRKENPRTELPIENIVVGDIIHLSAGDMIPADIRLIKTKDLFVSQAAMTGESQPVEKFSHVDREVGKQETDYKNIVFMGSNIVSGSATGVVIAVGDKTLFGKVAQDVSKRKGVTSFEKGISSVSWLLIRFMLVLVPAVFLINGLTKGNWFEAFLFGISVAVGLTPEMLPTIVTTNLVKGATAMAGRGTIVKNLNSIQNFGAIDVLCTDKTGTLTQDKVVLLYHLNIDGKEDNRVLRHAFFNSYYQTGLKNLLDIAIIDATNSELKISTADYKKVDEIPFDFERRRMSVVISDSTNKTQMITKGAIEEMLSVSSYVELNGKAELLTPARKTEILKQVDNLNQDGLRVLGIAQKTNPRVAGEFSIADEKDMVLIGYLAFLDPPKETTAPALQALKEHGVSIKVLTGDNELVTRSVCKQVGIEVDRIVHGAEIEELDEGELKDLVKSQQIFVKLTPQQKTKIVSALRSSGLTVGFLGDGINDAPAMKEADIGISVDTAVDIAKESADVILLEKDLLILEEGIAMGRATFGNIVKYIKITASSNFGNVFSVVLAAIFLPFLPMNAVQLLFLNMIYDISCVSLPFDNMDKEYLKKPRKWNAKSTSSFMRFFGPISSIFDVSTFLAMYFIICPAVIGGNFHSLPPEKQIAFIALFHAGWFVESLWSQTLVLHILRTPKRPFIESRASFAVISITTLGILVGTIVPFTHIGGELGLIALPVSYFLLLAATICAYIYLASLMKKTFIHKHGELI